MIRLRLIKTYLDVINPNFGGLKLKHFIIILSTIALFLGLTGLASAEPSLYGPSGLILNPTADIATPESAWIGVNNLSWDEEGLDSSIWTYTLTVGVSEEMELGAMGLYASDADDGFSLNAKYLLIVEDEEMPSIAAGFTYSDITDGQISTFYLVASKYFMADDIDINKAMSAHGGVCYRTGDAIEEEWDFWGGVDFNLSEKIIGIVEYSDDEEGIDGLVFGVRYYANETWTAQAGMIDGNLIIGSSYIF